MIEEGGRGAKESVGGVCYLAVESQSDMVRGAMRRSMRVYIPAIIGRSRIGSTWLDHSGQARSQTFDLDFCNCRHARCDSLRTSDLGR